MFKLSKSIRKELPKFIQQKQNSKKVTPNTSSLPDSRAVETQIPTTSTPNLKEATSAPPSQRTQVAPVDNTPATPHQFTRLDAFTGPFSWLGLIYPASVCYNGIIFPSAYHALIMAQFEGIEIELISQINHEEELLEHTKDKVESKDWQKTRLKIMEQIQRDKFRRNEDLQEKLKETGNRELVWTNKHDSFFGVVSNSGQNHLGRILQKIRDDTAGGDEFIAWLLMCHDINNDLSTQPILRLVETKEGSEDRKVIELKNKPYYKIGKLPDNDVVPLNPSVSRRHALITCLKTGEVLLFDLRSKSKTYLNGKQLEVDHLGYTLKNMDVVSLGTSSRKYSVEIDNKNIIGNLEKRARDLNREIKKLSGDVDTTMGIFLQGNTKVFVGNLSFDTHKTDLEEFFSGCGEIKSIYIPQKRTNEMDIESTGEYCTRGIAFVEFYTPPPARIALLKDGRSLNNRAVKVNMTDSKDKQKERFPKDTKFQGNDNKQGPQRSNFQHNLRYRQPENNQSIKPYDSKHESINQSPEHHNRESYKTHVKASDATDRASYKRRMRSSEDADGTTHKRRVRAYEDRHKASNQRQLETSKIRDKALRKYKGGSPESSHSSSRDRSKKMFSNQRREAHHYTHRESPQRRKKGKSKDHSRSPEHRRAPTQQNKSASATLYPPR